ncbi:hypothetical protein [Streptomyces sp. NPDC003952]
MTITPGVSTPRTSQPLSPTSASLLKWCRLAGALTVFIPVLFIGSVLLAGAGGPVAPSIDAPDAVITEFYRLHQTPLLARSVGISFACTFTLGFGVALTIWLHHTQRTTLGRALLAGVGIVITSLAWALLAAGSGAVVLIARMGDGSASVARLVVLMYCMIGPIQSLAALSALPSADGAGTLNRFAYRVFTTVTALAHAMLPFLALPVWGGRSVPSAYPIACFGMFAIWSMWTGLIMSRSGTATTSQGACQ